MRRNHGVEALYALGRDLQDRGSARAADMFRAMLLVAPTDERGWLALGACHEARGDFGVASELYAVGARVTAGGVRCDLARARLFERSGRGDEADALVAHAEAKARGDDVLEALVAASSAGRGS